EVEADRVAIYIARLNVISERKAGSHAEWSGGWREWSRVCGSRANLEPLRGSQSRWGRRPVQHAHGDGVILILLFSRWRQLNQAGRGNRHTGRWTDRWGTRDTHERIVEHVVVWIVRFYLVLVEFPFGRDQRRGGPNQRRMVCGIGRHHDLVLLRARAAFAVRHDD